MSDDRLQAYYLSRLERSAVAWLYARAGRHSAENVRDGIEESQGEPVAEAALKLMLTRMAEAGLLTSTRGCHGGYQLAQWFRERLDQAA